MVALITVKNADGIVAQCDAKCYDAHDAECLCICGGKNHGAGLERALEQSDELVDKLDDVTVRAFARAAGARRAGLELELGELLAGSRAPPRLGLKKRRRWLTPADDVRRVRAALQLSQAEFAARLGVSRRTVIRGELRGFEIPWRSERRGDVLEAWSALQKQAAAAALEPTSTPSSSSRSPAPGSPAKCHISTAAKSRRGKRDTLPGIPAPAIASSKKSNKPKKRRRLRLSSELYRDRRRGGRARGGRR